jgi:uncharacterized protein DUF1828
MTTATNLEKILCSTFCQAITVNPVPCGFAISASFTDLSGDRIGFYVVADGENYHLEDDGEYLAQLCALGIEIERGSRQLLLDSILQTAAATWDHDTYEIKTGTFEQSELPSRMIQFLSALVRIRDVELLTRDFVRSTFREDATAAIIERFGEIANIDERKPVSAEFQDYLPDLVIRPKKEEGKNTAVFLASGPIPFQEAELLRAEIEKEHRQDTIAVVALIEDTDKINVISPRRFQRAINRGLAVSIFRGDEPAAMSVVARQAGTGVG